MNHIPALDADLEPVDVGADIHNGPQCAVCGDFDCRNCNPSFLTEECEGFDSPPDTADVQHLIEQLHRHAELATRTQTALDTERELGREAAKVIRRLNIEVAQEHRGHALAKANQANADYREALAKAEVARLEAELAELRNTEPS